MNFLRALGFATALLLPVCASAQDTWTKNASYLKDAINDCSAAGSDRLQEREESVRAADHSGAA